MKTLRIAALAIGLAGGFAFSHVPVAMAQGLDIHVPVFNFSFDTGDVAYAYHDGYWDHDHHWHRWRDEREAREFRARYQDRYDDRMHDRVDHEGWREEHREEHEHHDHD